MKVCSPRKLIFCDSVHSAELSAVISALLISFLLILSLITVSFTLVICRMKFRAEARNKSTTRNRKGNVKKTNVLVVPNQAFALHNISRCVEVKNEVYTASQKAGNEEPVYELVK